MSVMHLSFNKAAKRNPVVLASGGAFLHCLLCSSLWAQAAFRLDNLVQPNVVNAPVFNSDGSPLEGDHFRAELYGGPEPDSLSPAVVFGYDIRFSTPFLKGGYFEGIPLGGPLAVGSPTPGGWSWLQVRAWDTQLGATYEEVLARGLGGYGESPLFYAQGGNPYDQFQLPQPLIGLQSFSVRAVVPEPATWALLAWGGLGLWWATRRRQNSPP